MSENKDITIIINDDIEIKLSEEEYNFILEKGEGNSLDEKFENILREAIKYYEQKKD